jgi:NADH-quinone oxidoreductase subunit L
MNLDLEIVGALMLVVPLLAATFITMFLRTRPVPAAALSVLAAAVILGLSMLLLFRAEQFQSSLTWFEIGGYRLELGFYFNDLAALMLLVTSVVGFLVHIFSLAYMKGEPGQARYYAGLSIFMFSMLGIILADDLIMIFIFWELVGVSSYILIGHYLDKPSAAAAAKKAFIVNRVGDFGFLIGIIWTYWTFDTVTLHKLAEATQVNPNLATAGAALCLFCGVLGKSAQFPLHVWLPDAMEGPTPVSALIHAATMVAAGIYLLARVFFLIPANALEVICYIGTFTAIFAAFMAFGQRDLKRILAYSTLSQLGYMVAAFGLGYSVASQMGVETEGSKALAGVGAAMFHLTTHGFFKALLFLGAGSVIYSCHHEQDIYRMGGLWKKMPVTFVTFTVALFALVGLFPFAGFWSKDAILYLALEKNSLVFGVLAFSAILTSAYMFRLWFIVFLGSPRSEESGHAHESSVLMTVPLVILAVLSALAGFAWMYPGIVQDFLHNVPHPEGDVKTTIVATGTTALLIGLVVAWIFYRPGSQKDFLQSRAPLAYQVLEERFYVDSLYGYYVQRVQQRFANLLGFLDNLLIGTLLVRGSAAVAWLTGGILRMAHTGNVHSYVYWFLFGIILYWLIATGVIPLS